MLAPGETFDLTITYSPLIATPNNGTLSIPYTGGNSPLTIALTGRGRRTWTALQPVNVDGLAQPNFPGFGTATHLDNSSQDTQVSDMFVALHSAENPQLTGQLWLGQSKHAISVPEGIRKSPDTDGSLEFDAMYPAERVLGKRMNALHVDVLLELAELDSWIAELGAFLDVDIMV